MKTVITLFAVMVLATACNESSGPVDKDYVISGNTYMTDLYTYEGPIVNEQPNGQGTISWKWGDTYVGNVVNGVPEGEGEMTYMDGGVYKGDWHEGLRHGQGIMTSPNGDIYTGSWANGAREGKGTILSTNMRQTCDFVGDIPSNCWVTDLTNCLEGDCQEGYGVKKLDYGTYYGKFAGGYFVGVGKIVYNNGDVFEANFYKGESYGRGVLVSEANGYVIKGHLKGGKWIDGVKTYNDDRAPEIMMRGIYDR
jgi:hypothetical protein